MKLNTENSTILIVDDDRDILNVLTDILKFGGYQAISTENGEDAIKVLNNHKIDLVLLDLILRDMHGIEVLKQIVKKNPDQLVMMVSGEGSIEDAVEATKNGAYDFLVKPLEASRILLSVKNALEKTFLVRGVTQV